MYQQIVMLYEIQELDNKIDKEIKEIEHLKNDPQLCKLRDYKCKLEKQWEDTHQELIDCKKKLRTAEMDLVELAQILEDIENKIYDRKTSSKELEFLLKEKESQAYNSSNLESNIISLLEEIDLKENLHNEQKNVLRDINKKVSELSQDIKSKVNIEMDRIKEYENEKKRTINEISAKLVKEYNTKRSQLKNQLVSLVDENKICSGCHVKISSRIFKKVIEHSVIKCEGCGRYLILCNGSRN